MSFPAVLTLWFVNTADPAGVLEREPKADRGFGRKLLSQLNVATSAAIAFYERNR